MLKTKLILVLAVASSACYQYYQVEDTAPLPEAGAEVRAELTTPQDLDLGDQTLHDVSRIEGEVYRSGGDTLGLFSRRIHTAYGSRQFTDGAVFYFDRSQFVRLEQRTLAPVQTGITLGVLAAGALTAVFLVSDLGGGAETGSGSRNAPQNGIVVGVPLNWIIP